MSKKPEEKFDDKEAQQRFETALRGGLKTKPAPLKEKPKSRRPKRKKSREGA